MSTPEQRKIKRLERDLKFCRQELERAAERERILQRQLDAERAWRRSFQRLIKTAALSDTLDVYDDGY